MVQVIQGKDITLAQLIDDFGLQYSDDEQFFPEWQNGLPELSDSEKQSMGKPMFGLSYTLSSNREDDLCRVVQILRHLANLVRQ